MTPVSHWTSQKPLVVRPGSVPKLGDWLSMLCFLTSPSGWWIPTVLFANEVLRSQPAKNGSASERSVASSSTRAKSVPASRARSEAPEKESKLGKAPSTLQVGFCQLNQIVQSLGSSSAPKQ